MKELFAELAMNEAGMILSAEMVLILTIAVLGIVVGLVQVQQAVVSEFQDLALAFYGLNQSYATPSYFGCMKWWGRTSWSAGSGFFDYYNGCVGPGAIGGGFGYGGGFGGGYAEIGGGGTPYNLSSASTQSGSIPSMPCETCPTEAPTCGPINPGTVTSPIQSPSPVPSASPTPIPPPASN